MSAPLLSLDKVKLLLGIDVDDNDEKLTAALPVVTEYFENHCKRGLAFVEGVVEEMGVTPRLALFRFPVDDVSELQIDGLTVAVPVVPALDKQRGFIRTSGGSWARVTYDGGFAEDDVPADLADAYARAVADYAGVSYSAGASTGGGAPLKSLGLGSGALTVAFETGAVGEIYDTSSVPPLLAPYLFVLDHYRLKDYV